MYVLYGQYDNEFIKFIRKTILIIFCLEKCNQNSQIKNVSDIFTMVVESLITKITPKKNVFYFEKTQDDCRKL